jgi:hypothetical protein
MIYEPRLAAGTEPVFFTDFYPTARDFDAPVSPSCLTHIGEPHYSYRKASFIPQSVIHTAKRHSYRKASVGLSCEARLAGSIPKITPTTNETPNATKTDVTEMGT